MRKLAIILVILLIFTGCKNDTMEKNKPDKFVFSTTESKIFPFYCVDDEDVLWRVEKDGASTVGITVSDKSYIKYLKNEDTVIFTTAHYDKKGVAYCQIIIKNGNNKPESIFDKVRLDSIRVQNDGNLLFIDEEDNLYFRRDGILSRIESGVAQCEFVGEDAFLFRSKKEVPEEKETVYPIYYATFDYRNFLMNGAEIIASDSENGKAYIIKNRHTVQKRTASKEVADCYVFGDGEILFSISSALLTQFEENKYMFLVAVNEDAVTLKYDLYRIDGAEPILTCQNIMAGRYISKNVFAYEIQTAEDVKTCIVDHTDRVYTYSLGEKCSLESIYYVEPYTYVLKEDELLMLDESGIGALVDDDIQSIKVVDGALICFKEKMPPYTISVCIGTSVQNKVGDVVSNDVYYKDDLLYYYTGEGRDLNTVDKFGNRTALIGNIDRSVKFICDKDTVAVLKDDTKTLFIAYENGITDTELRIKKIIMEE